ncbi:MAG: efflux RND transporter periplasmic adaptor subunit [Parvibaculaceae bacterium]|nr:efflux RND transporter periplasmic adaptor subunit [Parvibaculaceae bacterium]
MSLRRSHILALIIAAIIGAWVLSGQIGNGDAEVVEVDENGEIIEPADTQETATRTPRVRAAIFHAESRNTEVVIRGRTEAVRSVQVRAETSGTIVELPVEKGSSVQKGDVICRLSLNARDARMAEAEALMRQRWLELDAAQKLAARGHRSETQAAASQAAYDAARAQVKQQEIELSHTRILAPFDGVLDARPVEVGDYLQVSQPCATIVDMDPFLVIGQVAETDVDKLQEGTVGIATLVTGETVEGRVRFISTTADAATRTFRVELEVPNPERKLRSGVTAEIKVPSTEVMAHRVPPSILGLDDAGTIGLRILDENNVVHFQRVQILADGPAGVWVTGLPTSAKLITVGQDFVVPGQTVDVTYEDESGTAS